MHRAPYTSALMCQCARMRVLYGLPNTNPTYPTNPNPNYSRSQ